ncbi:MAG TPA: alpha/beta fold hydrolase [Syntrophales bacterium]|nr:alpha/beta fold hydrolase [Syntrophales bacterium]
MEQIETMKKKWLFLLLFCALAVALLALFFMKKDVGQPRYFKDQAYYYETLRALSRCSSRGTDVAEIYATIKGIPSGNEQEWFRAWERTAIRIEKRAESLKDPISRGWAYFRAHNYRRSAEFFLMASDPKRPESYSKCVEAFYKGLDSLKVNYERIHVPYEGKSLQAVYYPGPSGSERKPLIVAMPGFDGMQEEVYFTIASAATQHGYSVLTFDGPGQGSALRNQNLKFTAQWEKPVAAVLDEFLRTHQRPTKIVLFGSSFGGYLAPRAAAFEKRVDGVVAYDVFFDFQEVFLHRIPPFARTAMRYLLDNKMDGTVGFLINVRSWLDPSLRWGFANLRWTMGDGEPAELYRRLAAYSLKDAAKSIRCDVLIFGGKNDHFIPENQIKDFQQSLINARSVSTFVYSEETGGDQHCQQGAMMLWQEDFFDWLKEKFPPSNHVK